MKGFRNNWPWAQLLVSLGRGGKKEIRGIYAQAPRNLICHPPDSRPHELRFRFSTKARNPSFRVHTKPRNFPTPITLVRELLPKW